MPKKPLTAINGLAASQAPDYLANIRMSGVGVDEDTVTVGGVIYHLTNGTAAVSPEVEVDITGSQTAAATATALTTAINSQFGTTGIRAVDGGSRVLLSSAAPFTVTETLTNGTVDPATAAGGAAPDEVRAMVTVERVPTAAEVTAGIMEIGTKQPVLGVIAQVKVTATNALKAYDGDVSYSGNVITLNNDGAVDFAATDTVTVIASTEI